MTAYLKYVILGLIAIVGLLVGGIVAIAVIQTLKGADVSVPAALITLVGTPLGALVGILVPAQLTQRNGPPQP